MLTKFFPREAYVAFVSPPGWKTDMYFSGAGLKRGVEMTFLV